jgi:hypothetical protein
MISDSMAELVFIITVKWMDLSSHKVYEFDKMDERKTAKQKETNYFSIKKIKCA